MAGLPFLWGVLYKLPNPDNSRKRCDNCMMFVTTGQCVIHRQEQPVKADQVCGYHVFGKPMPKWMDHPGMKPTVPELSGLRNAGAGLACANCQYYGRGDGNMGWCQAIANEDTFTAPQKVHALGWCARHESI